VRITPSQGTFCEENLTVSFFIPFAVQVGQECVCGGRLGLWGCACWMRVWLNNCVTVRVTLSQGLFYEELTVSFFIAQRMGPVCGEQSVCVCVGGGGVL
jgi:hypothetical protein